MKYMNTQAFVDAFCDAFPDPLTTYLVSTDGRTLGGPGFIAVANAGGGRISLRLDAPIPAPEAGMVTLRGYDGTGACVVETDPVAVQIGDSVSYDAQSEWA